MARRLHVSQLRTGQLFLDVEEAHHARNVLRLEPGQEVELFDDAGAWALGRIERSDGDGVAVYVETIGESAGRGREIVIAAAVPKGERADWMVEKLSELGVSALVPLVAQRSVVVPAGKGKMQRWQRIAVESAKQSRRSGVMRIEPVTRLTEVLGQYGGWYLSTAAGAEPLARLLGETPAAQAVMLYVGPEGGWTEEEMAAFEAAGCRGVSLSATVLRVETAAVAAAAVAACWG